MKQEGVRADLASDLTLFANKVAVGKEGIAQASGLGARLFGKETSKALEPGEQLYLYAADVNDKEVRLQFVTTKTYQVAVQGSTKEMRYKALLVLQFEPTALQSMNADQVFQSATSVFTTKDEASAPKSLKLGLTRAEVEAMVGKPDRILDLGERITYVYKDLRVVFVDGKVTDLQ